MLIWRAIAHKLNIQYTILRYKFRKMFFDTEYANKLFLTIRRETVIPLLRLNRAKIGENTSIDTPLILHYKNEDISNLTIGNNCSISKNCFLDLAGPINIDDNCTLAMNVSLITHIDLGKSSPTYRVQNNTKEIRLKKGIYIGANTLILKGVTIGENVLIAAQSLVNKDLESNGLYGGSPAIKIK